MDFLDPQKNRAHTRRLLLGYVLIGVAIVLAVTVLLYLTYGFTIKKGKVVQNGLVFVSSNPGGANIYLNNTLKDTTSSRLTLEAGTYALKLARNGYRDWQRAVTVEGGSVEHVDYPFLVPTNLSTSDVSGYKSAPPLTLQSPDRRWLLVEQPDTLPGFDMYDLKDPKNITKNETHFTLPDNLLTTATGKQSLKLVNWSNDAVHVVVEHIYDGHKVEYILIDRKDPTQSVNLTKTLKLTATMQLDLQDKKFDHYFIYNMADQSLSTDTISSPALQPVLQHVLAYKSYSTDTFVYATSDGAAKGDANVDMYLNGKSYVLRSVPQSPTYLLELSRYSGAWYVVAGVPAEGRVYVYKDPVSVLQDKSDNILVPVSVLKVVGATHVSFSANSQFVAAENGKNFAVYDIEYDKSYTYTADAAPDAPQVYATWMDGDRLQLISGGQVVIFDYDGTNEQTLVPELPAYEPFFDSSYRDLYTLAKPVAKKSVDAQSTPAQVQIEFTQTSMRTPADQ